VGAVGGTNTRSDSTSKSKLAANSFEKGDKKIGPVRRLRPRRIQVLWMNRVAWDRDNMLEVSKVDAAGAQRRVAIALARAN
jgi:hypothetical protein